MIGCNNNCIMLLNVPLLLLTSFVISKPVCKNCEQKLLLVIFKTICKYCEQKLLLFLIVSSLLIGVGTFIPVYFNSCAYEIFDRGLLFKLE